MRLSLFIPTGLLVLTASAVYLPAQSNPPAANPPASRENAMISFLTPEQQQQYALARAKALADNPDLKAEGEDIIKQVMASGGQPDQEIIEKMNSHRQKLRQAMLKEDPTLEPIFAEIDKHISELKAKQSGQMQNSGSNAAPSSH
jgi:hypothetical protein